jgi:hypothetical protein
MMSRWLAFVFLAGVFGCVESAEPPTLPEQILPVTITATDRELDPGESTTFTVAISNPLDELVRLTFPTSCQLLVFVKNGSGKVFTPKDGRHACASVPSVLTLEVGETKSYDVIWSGGIQFGTPGASERVPPGSYFASAEFRADGYIAIAFPILVEVK